MAGIAKPDVPNLGSEAPCTEIGYTNAANRHSGVNSGLLDGTQVNEWDTVRVQYWNNSLDYVELILSPLTGAVNIWRSGTTAWITYTRTLKIMRWNGLSYDDVTSLYPQTVTQINNTQWEKTISNLPSGRYRFERDPEGTNGTLRLDSEWYIEEYGLHGILVHHNGSYKKYTDGTWINYGNVVPSELDYINNGMKFNELSLIPSHAWNQLAGIVELNCYVHTNTGAIDSTASFTIETEPFKLTDVVGTEFDLLYYTDNENVTSANSEVVAYYSPLMELENPKLLCYSQNDSAKTLTIHAIPKNRTVIPNESFGTHGQLNYLSLSDTSSGHSFIKVLVSNNNGVSWKTFVDGNWIDVDINDDHEVEQFGIAPHNLIHMTSNDWDSLGNTLNLRLSYYFSQHRIEDSLSLETLTMNHTIPIYTPIVNSLEIKYKKIDEQYSGLMFMDEDEQLYTTSLGELIKYLDMGSLIAGQTSLDVKVKLANTLPFAIEDVVISKKEDIEHAEIQLSYSNLPFISLESLQFGEVLQYGDTIDFYVRVSSHHEAVGGGNFEVHAKASPVIE